MALHSQVLKQPFFIVADDAHERMLNQLKSGSAFAKTFIGHCPHSGNSKKCKCPFFKNVLDPKGSGQIVREVDGQFKPVLPLSFVIRLKMADAVISPICPHQI